MFALDYTYTLCTMATSPHSWHDDSHRSVLQSQMNAGTFVVHKTDNKFSAMAIEQCHEQNTVIIKGSWRAVVVTGNPWALRLDGDWPGSSAKGKRVLGPLGVSKTIAKHDHHEHHLGIQAIFMKDVKSLTGVMEDMGDTFLEQSLDLMVLDTRDIVDASVAESAKDWNPCRRKIQQVCWSKTSSP